MVGTWDGTIEMLGLWEIVGYVEGKIDEEGDIAGRALGTLDGKNVGEPLGDTVCVGRELAAILGDDDGSCDGTFECVMVGDTVGARDGKKLGTALGDDDGSCDGTS